MSDKTLREETLEEAIKLTTGDRNKTYGEPIDDFRKVAEAMNAYGYRGPGGRLLQPTDVPFFQTIVKLSRLVTTPDKADSWVDIAGYAACGREVSEQQKGEEFKENPLEPIKLSPNFMWTYFPGPLGAMGRIEMTLPARADMPSDEDLRNLAKEAARKVEASIASPIYTVKTKPSGATVLTWKTNRRIWSGGSDAG